MYEEDVQVIKSDINRKRRRALASCCAHRLRIAGSHCGQKFVSIYPSLGDGLAGDRGQVRGDFGVVLLGGAGLLRGADVDVDGHRAVVDVAVDGAEGPLAGPPRDRSVGVVAVVLLVVGDVNDPRGIVVDVGGVAVGLELSEAKIRDGVAGDEGALQVDGRLAPAGGVESAPPLLFS